MLSYMISMLPYEAEERGAADKTDSEEEAHRCEPGIGTKRPAIRVKFIPPKLDVHDNEEEEEEEEDDDDDYLSPQPSGEGEAAAADDDGDYKRSASLTEPRERPNATEDDVEAAAIEARDDDDSSKENKDAAGSDIKCPECRNPFRSLKSLYGHLRSHPDRGYRGASRPPTLSQRRPPRDHDAVPPRRRTKKARTGGSETKQTEELEAANTLMMIRESKSISADVIDQILDTVRNASTRIIRGKGLEAESPEEEVEEEVEEEKKSLASSKKRGYQCSICHKSFRTHQALGGHRASHNKHKNGSEAETPSAPLQAGGGTGSNSPTAEHRCRVCDKTFDTGQALGGHKRRHYLAQGAEGRVGASPSNFAVPSAVVNARSADEAFMIDLNEPPSGE